METKTTVPNFTLSLRGYDRMEVDDYLDGLAEALGQVDAATAASDQMQAEISRLRARVAELETCIRTETPRTGPALAERIALILQEAELAAAETVGRADAEAEDMRRAARLAGTEAENQARSEVGRAEEQARRIETAARADATEIVAEAEARAVARTRQIERWAEQVVSHTRAEEARMAAEKAAHRAGAEAELATLVAKREAVAASLAKLRQTLGEALGLIEPAGDPMAVPLAAEVRADAPDDLLADVPADVPSDAPAVVPADALADVPADVPADAPAVVPADAHADVPADVPADAPADVPARVADFEDSAFAVDTTGEIAVVEGADDDHHDPGDGPDVDEDEDHDVVVDADADDEERPWPAAFNPIDEGDAEGAMGDLDTRFDAWVASDEDTSGARHFKHRF